MGEVFAGRYELVDPLGEGGMASVWRVWDAREERLVAAKVLRQSDAVSLLRFVREQAVRITHPHVLTPLGWAGEDDRVLFTMPIVAGGSVANLVGDFGALPPVLAAELLRQLLSALEAVHAAEILHRDVKPANLLLTASGSGRPHLFLSDFGIAVDLLGPRLTETGTVVGTPGYLAPELERSLGPATNADLYAAGRVALVMLTGARARDLGSPLAPQVPPRPPQVPEPLWDLVVDLCQTEPSARPPTATEALARLDVAGVPWADGALGDVEVFTHVEPNQYRRELVATATGVVLREPGDGSGPTVMPTPSTVEIEGTTRVRREVSGGRPDAPAAPTPSRSPEGSGRGSGRPAADTPSGRRGVAVPVGSAAVAAAVVVGLLVWSPWSGAGGGLATPGSSPSSSMSSATTETVAPSTPGASTTRPSTTQPSTTTPGSVVVGPVIGRVGQSCEFGDVGIQERTVDGTPVVCQRHADGSYVWDRPAG